MTAGQALLVGVLVVPAAGAVVAASVPARADRAGRLVATVAAGIAVVLSIALISGQPSPLPPGPIRLWHLVDLPWVPGLDLRFQVGVDGVSYPLVVLTTLLTALCCGYTLWTVPADRAGRHLSALLLVIEVGIVGVFLSLNLILFFLFFEVVLLPMYAVIAGWGGPARRHAATKFVLYTLAGSVLLLLGVVLVSVRAGTADLMVIAAGHRDGLTAGVQLAAFVLLGLAFAVKSPLWPLHSWLPDAHTEAPTVGSVILAGVLLKMGTYGLIRIGLTVAPDGARRLAPVLGVLAVAAILVGGLVCLAQTELKRLIAYSSVGHMGFVLLGIATLNGTGIRAALIGNIAHGVITGLLFFLAGGIKDRAHTGDLALLGGLRERLPGLAGLLGFAAIASLGLPGLAGFWGEAFAVIAAVRRGGPLWYPLAVLAALGGALAAGYFLRLLRKVSHGPVGAAWSGPPIRLTGAEAVAWTPLVALAVLVGVLPGLVIGLVTGPLDLLGAVVIR